MDLSAARWIWCNDERPNTYCCARGRLDVPAPVMKAEVRVFADSRYQVWVNGRYIGQGPTPFRKPHIYFDTFDITAHLRKGKNVIAILATYHGVKHCTYSIGKPGIIASVEAVDVEGRRHELVTDDTWRVSVWEAFARAVPRRNWATAWMEWFDARREPVGWQDTGFDDSSWSAAAVVDPGPMKMYPRIVPYLKEYAASPVGFVGAWSVPTMVPTMEELTPTLDREPLVPLSVSPTSFPLEVSSCEHGTAFAVDFGHEIAGQIEFEIESPEGVTVDFSPAENLRDGRPWCDRKGTNYAKRYTTRTGRQVWRTFGYDGLRYVHVVVRGPHPEIVFHRVGVWRRETSLAIRARFECDDPIVNRIWAITCHTMTIGAQDVHVDCPTREQTSAWGDHVWSGLWAACLTGDTSHLRHLMLSARQIQWPCGQMNCYAFSAADIFPLYDYSFICVLGVWLYYELTADRDMAEWLMPTVERIFAWHDKYLGPTGLIELDGQKAIDTNTGQLFIDHPGFKAHNHPYPGLDRRGISAGLNFFYILALDAVANLWVHLGQPEQAKRYHEKAQAVRTAAHRLFFDARRGVYADGFHEGKLSDHISQQINALAVLSGTCPAERAPAVLKRVLDPNDSNLCRCGGLQVGGRHFSGTSSTACATSGRVCRGTFSWPRSWA